MLSLFIDPEQIGSGDRLVWDSSVLSHSFEEFSHATMSAYMEMSEPRTWDRLKRRLLRRFESEHLGRRLLLNCDILSCIVPESVYRELYEDPHYRDSLDILTGFGYRVEERYVRRKSGRGSPHGFSRVFVPRLHIEKPRQDLVDYVLAMATRYGYRVSRVDAEGIALAIQENAVLVTSDRNQAELADRLGLRVLYAIGSAIGRKEKALSLT